MFAQVVEVLCVTCFSTNALKTTSDKFVCYCYYITLICCDLNKWYTCDYICLYTFRVSIIGETLPVTDFGVPQQFMFRNTPIVRCFQTPGISGVSKHQKNLIFETPVTWCFQTPRILIHRLLENTKSGGLRGSNIFGVSKHELFLVICTQTQIHIYTHARTQALKLLCASVLYFEANFHSFNTIYFRTKSGYGYISHFKLFLVSFFTLIFLFYVHLKYVLRCLL